MCKSFFEALFGSVLKASSLSIVRFVFGLLFSCLLAGNCRAEELRFAPLVHLKLVSPVGAGDVGTLATEFTGNEIHMTLDNVAAGGASNAQELQTRLDRKDLSLLSSRIYDVVKGKPIRQMVRKTGTSLLGGGKAELFEYKEFSDGDKVTVTEPYVEFKVADFVSVMLIAADAINRQDLRPIDVSLLRDRSVVRATVKIVGPDTVGGHQGTVVRVAPPDNPTGGIAYTIAKTDDGAYFPATIRAETTSGTVELAGSIQ